MALFKVEICGVNTSKLPLLTEDEKKELFKEIKKGNEVAREKYIRGNLRLVLSILQRFSNSNENVDDLFQIGCIGLIKAVDNFDDTLNVKFSTYAVPMISGELKRYCSNQGKSFHKGHCLQSNILQRKYNKNYSQGAYCGRSCKRDRSGT